MSSITHNMKSLAVLCIVVNTMGSMTAMKQQKSKDKFRGLFSLRPCSILWPVNIDKSWPIHTSSNCAMLSDIG
jgi:hypothetical protein